MGKYDNYDNAKNIKKAQKNLDKLTRKRKPDQYKIELAREKLDIEKLFESCQIFKSSNNRAPNDRVLFSDDNQVMLFGNKLIRYKDIKSYQIVENVISKSYTVTRQSGVIPRAIVGHAIAGDMGAVVGAMTADSHSDTTYYQTGDGFNFQVFLKSGGGYQLFAENDGFFFNKIHKKWLELGTKIQRIIDGKN
jgi:hypothetical protein